MWVLLHRRSGLHSYSNECMQSHLVGKANVPSMQIVKRNQAIGQPARKGHVHTVNSILGICSAVNIWVSNSPLSVTSVSSGLPRNGTNARNSYTDNSACILHVLFSTSVNGVVICGTNWGITWSGGQLEKLQLLQKPSISWVKWCNTVWIQSQQCISED